MRPSHRKEKESRSSEKSYLERPSLPRGLAEPGHASGALCSSVPPARSEKKLLVPERPRNLSAFPPQAAVAKRLCFVKLHTGAFRNGRGLPAACPRSTDTVTGVACPRGRRLRAQLERTPAALSEPPPRAATARDGPARVSNRTRNVS